jgi:type VI secretion system secreted protein VgrG
MGVTTPLGTDVLLLAGFSGTEGLSQLFHLQLDLLAELKKEVAFQRLLGQSITLRVDLPDKKKRFFNGICIRMSEGDRDTTFTTYRMEIVPKLWLLTKRRQSRIFQQLSVPDILKQVFAGLDVDWQIQGTFQPRDYCVQYRESDFHFASRLMEEEGIYYYFKHKDGGHTLVVANTPQSHAAMPEIAAIQFEQALGGTRPDHRILTWEKTQELRSGKFTLWDHCFELPYKNLEATKPITDSVQVGNVSHSLKTANSELEVYDFPGAYAQRFDGVAPGGADRAADLQKIFQDNARTVEIRMQQEAVGSLLIQGTSTARQLTSGHKFTLSKHFNANGDYVLTTVQHSARIEDYRSSDSKFTYQNSFTCIPFALPYRPLMQHRKPTVEGSQTATVVGPKGQEIYTDKYGRVKVQFHWDRQGKKDANSSCWVRVGQLWAGKRWGASFWPRISQEVIVDFLEGDPDQPIIVGSVYNADQMPPYLGKGPDSKLPDNNQISGVKSNSTPDGKGYNEWRFNDTKDKEQIFIHAQRNMDVRVLNDSMEGVLNDKHVTVGKEKDKTGDFRELVYRDHHANIKRHQIEKIEGNFKLTVGKGESSEGGNSDVVIEKNRKEWIGEEAHLHVVKNQLCQVDGDQDLGVMGVKRETIASDSHVHVKKNFVEQVDKDYSVTIGTSRADKVGQNYAVEAGQAMHLKAGMALVIEAGTQLTLKVGGNFVDISPAGVTIVGTMVSINGPGAAGSGAGASPAKPDDAKAPKNAEEAKPTKPVVADDAVSGQKSVS